MQWHMYHSVGLDNCQGEFWAIRDGKRFDYCQWGELAKCYKWYGETLTTRQLRWIERFREQP